MPRRLTHLNGIRAFEAAARHMSFAKAAQELSVTPAAVSQQVKALEDYLGVALFRRTKRALFLTETAQAVLPAATEGFDLLAAVLTRARSRVAGQRLVVSVTPSFAAKWLMPRLEDFIAHNAGIDVRIDTSTRLVDFLREDVDMAVRYGSGTWPGLAITPLMREQVYPVCSPRLIKPRHPLQDPRDLRHYTLIHDDSLPAGSAFPSWPGWLEAAGAPGVDASRGLHVNASMVAIQAAVDGQGIALGRSVLVDDDLVTSRLVRPFTLTLPLRYGYFIVHPKILPTDSQVPRFSRWLLAQAKRHAPQRTTHSTKSPGSHR
jgi:LysR family transcriptional regulator, glycine cleavage system transcriptional activator